MLTEVLLTHLCGPSEPLKVSLQALVSLWRQLKHSFLEQIQQHKHSHVVIGELRMRIQPFPVMGIIAPSESAFPDLSIGFEKPLVA